MYAKKTHHKLDPILIMSMLGVLLGKGGGPVMFRQFEYADSEYIKQSPSFILQCYFA